MPPCLTETAQPNAIPSDGGLPYSTHPLGSIQSVAIEVLYDDLSTDVASFDRNAVLMP